MEPQFNHEKLEVHQLGRELNRRMQPLLRRIPRGQANVRDNLDRAARSISRNIAEGAGKWAVADKINFYRIAKGSAAECAACLDELVDCGVMREDAVAELKALLARITAMLIRLIQATESRTPRSSGRRGGMPKQGDLRRGPPRPTE